MVELTLCVRFLQAVSLKIPHLEELVFDNLFRVELLGNLNPNLKSLRLYQVEELGQKEMKTRESCEERSGGLCKPYHGVFLYDLKMLEHLVRDILIIS